MDQDTRELLMLIFTKCRDDVVRLRNTMSPGPNKGYLLDYVQLLLIARQSIKQLEYED